ncbi:MAG: 5'-nucleotidase C-terminal domain-containing protein [Blautia sp.]|nr:5'-nucleotidase C-terminal domain-containing protein [Blautia sp.]
MKLHRILVALFSAAALLAGTCMPAIAEEAAAGDAEVKKIRIIGTSDLHGKFVPYDYALNEESTSGSVAQLATAIAEYRDEDTLLFDAGDTIQDNSADIFVSADESIHPMVLALNALDYDVWVTGNHEYNYGMDVLEDTIGDMEAKTLVGNVYDEDGEPVADDYTIFDVDGVRVAVIGMVTPNITRWDAVNLADCTVTDPLEETRKAIEDLAGQYDVLVGVYHMGLDNEYGVENSGVTDICNACPEFDVMISSHEHAEVPGTLINGVLVVQNKNMAQTMNVIDLTLEPDEDGWKVVDKTSESVAIADYEADPAIVELLAEYDEEAKEDAETVIGKLEGGALAPEDEIDGIPTAQIEDTALIDLINEVQMYYTGAPVSAAALFVMDANMQPGEIQKSDMALIYKYTNTLYKLHMTGEQLKKYMEWSYNYYNTYEPGDLTISFNPDIRAYNFDMFAGVNYDVNIANEPGSRIENLTWPDGTPVKDDDEFDIAVNNYRANSQLLAPGEIYEEDDMPYLVEMDVRGDIGGVRELIRDYIINVKGGVITPEVDNNWDIIGNDWDEELHDKVADMVEDGELTIQSSEDGRTPNVVPITEEDVK